jgi:hypothetical protein
VGTNGLAIAALVLGICGFLFVTAVLAIIFGGVSLHQIKSTGNTQRGRGLAIAGLVLGAIWVLLFVFGVAHGRTCVNGVCRRR